MQRAKADGGGGPPHHQAQHRQPRAVRLRHARRGAPRRDRQPAAGLGLLGQQGAVLRAQGDHALHAAEGHRRRGARRHLHRQRRVRADRHVDAGPARRRRRGAGARARLSAVDRGGEPGRRHARGTTSATRAPAGCPTSPTSAARSRRARARSWSSIPNNPTGALYPVDLLRDIVEIAREHQLIVFADEIYDKTLYDGAQHTSIASLADDVLFVTFNGLSKNYRACGYRSGWMVISGDKRHAPTTSTGSTSSPRCACAPTCRGSSRSRRRSAATRASTTSWRPAGRLAQPARPCATT